MGHAQARNAEGDRRAWMRSQGHRENILDAHYRDTGMGIVAAVPRSFGSGQPGAIYTQDFGVIIGG